MLSKQVGTLLKMHEDAVKAENMTAESNLRSHNLLLEADIAKYLVSSAKEHLLDIVPVKDLIDPELVAQNILGQVVGVDHHVQPR